LERLRKNVREGVSTAAQAGLIGSGKVTNPKYELDPAMIAYMLKGWVELKAGRGSV
jgi:hypothetical protein